MKEKIKAKVEKLAERLFDFYDSPWGWKEKLMVTGIAAGIGTLVGIFLGTCCKGAKVKEIDKPIANGTEEADAQPQE